MQILNRRTTSRIRDFKMNVRADISVRTREVSRRHSELPQAIR
jgi:hypothetical protein